VIIFREYKCPVCGFEAWAMDYLLTVICHKCGTIVQTKEIDLSVDHLRKELENVDSS